MSVSVTVGVSLRGSIVVVAVRFGTVGAVATWVKAIISARFVGRCNCRRWFLIKLALRQVFPLVLLTIYSEDTLKVVSLMQCILKVVVS